MIGRTFESLRRAVGACACFSVLVAVAGEALAAPINYGNFVGNTVTYQAVTESSATDPQFFPPNPPVGLFGAPTVSGDSIDFSPLNFYALSDLQAPPLDRTDGHLTFGISAHPGYGINNLNLQEGGNLSVSGFGTDATYADVSAIGFLQVHEIDGVSINTQTFPINLTFNFGSNGAQDNGTWRLGSEGPVDGFLWTGNQYFDIRQGLIDRGFAVNIGATKVSLNLDNILYAQSEPLAGAFIDKKDFGGLTITVNIPEPASLALVALGLVSVIASARRRSIA